MKNIRVNTNELAEISKSISTKNDELTFSYRSRLINLILDSSRILKEENVDIDSLISKVNNGFKNYELGMYDVLNLLNNNVINGYNDWYYSILNSFNVTFADRIQELLSMNRKR